MGSPRLRGYATAFSEPVGGAGAAGRGRKVSFLGSIDNLSGLQGALKKKHESKLAGYKARFDFAQKAVSRHLASFGKTGKPKSCENSFRLFQLCRWPDSFVTANGELEAGTIAPSRIPMIGYPGIIGSAHVAFTHVPMPMLVGKHGMEISSSRAFLERTEVKDYDEYTTLTDHAIGVYHAQIEMCANWNIETKAGLHELETCILEAAELINRLATPQLRNWHKGNKEDKELNNATFKAWSEAISGIARLVFGDMNWKPKQSFNCASKLGHEFLHKPEMILEVESSDDETLESLFIKFFSPQRGQMWELWSWLNTLKE